MVRPNLPKNKYNAPIILAHADTRSALAIGRSFARHGISFIPAVSDLKQFSCYSRYFRRQLVEVANPEFEPERFADQILSIAERFGAAAILPVTDPAMGSLNSANDRLPSHTCLMAPGSQAIDAVLDKDTNIGIAEELGIPYPRTIKVEKSEDIEAAGDEFGYPIVLKRRSKQQVIPSEVSDFSIEVVCNAQELRQIVSRLSKHGVVPQVQKFVVGEMHNICCFATRGKIVAAHEYIAIRRGKHEDIARKFVETDGSRIRYVERMLGAINWEGVANVSFLVDNNEDKTWYLETNGRFWASVQGSVNAGWDFPYWAVRYFLHDEVPTPPPISEKTKITCYHTADLSALIVFLRGSRSPVTAHMVNPWAAIWQYLRAFGPGFQADVFQWSDPLPAIIDHVRLATRSWNGLVRRFENRDGN